MPPYNIYNGNPKIWNLYNKAIGTNITAPNMPFNTTPNGSFGNNYQGLDNYSIMPDNSFTKPNNRLIFSGSKDINQTIKNPIGLVTESISSLAGGLDNIDEQNARDNAGREDLAPYVVGNTWGDIFNSDNRTSEALQIVRDSTKDYSNVQNNQNLMNAWNPNDLQTEAQAGTSNGWDILSDAGTGASIGASIGSIVPGIGTGIGAVAGTALGALSGLARSIFGDSENKKRAKELNKAINRANVQQVSNFYNTAQVNNQRNLRQNMMNYFADGGNLEGLNGIVKVNEGGTHGQNPYAGVTMGIAPDGIPNKVEEGEIVYNDYVYSNRLKPSKTLLKNTILPEKYEGLTYAKIAEKIQKESEDRPNDPVSRRTLDEMMNRLMSAQEEQKAKIEERRLAKVIDEMPTEDKAALVASLLQQNQPQYGIDNLGQMPQQPMQEVPQEALGVQEPNMDLGQPMYAHGGKIFIRPSKKGTFTAAAKKRGMGVQEFASKVLAHPENYTEAMRKKAQFAHNSKSFKHAEGGYLYPFGGWATQDELNDYYTQQYTNFWNNLQGRKGSNVNRAYLTGAQARQWVNMLSQGDEKQKALADMLKNQWGDNLDWSENANWEFKNKYNPNGTVTESNPYLEWAGDNTAMKDSLWGIKHVPQLSVDNRYLNTTGGIDANTSNWLVDNNTLANPTYIFGIPQTPPLRPVETRVDVSNNTANNYYTPAAPWTPRITMNLQGPISTETNTSTTTNTTTTNNNTNATTPPKEIKLSRSPEWFRYAPLLGGLGAFFQRPDYTYANELRGLASQYRPIGAPHIGGYRRYNPYDINLGDAENIALTAAAINANRGQNRDTQGALNTAAINAAQRTAAQRNLAWQQANEENRLNTDTYNLGIDKTNLATTQAYDQLNQEINNRRVNMLQAAAAAQDASQTAWVNALSNNITNSLNNLGNLGKENWAANQRNALIELLGSDALAKALGLI